MKTSYAAACALGAALVLGACGDGGPAADAEAVVLDASAFETAGSYLGCLEGRGAIVSAHRGGPRPGFPENAIETFEDTLRRVPALIETDVRQTADGVFVLLHDETVDRTTNGRGAIADMTLAEAKTLRLVDDAGTVTAFQIPTLDEALKAMRGRTVLELDVKRGVDVAEVARAVAARDAESFAAIITYSFRDALSAAAAAPGISIVPGIDDRAGFRSLTDGGIDDERLIAWTGIIDEPDADLYAFLGERDIAAAGGAMGALDRRATSEGGAVYRELEELGLDILATDRPVEAARALGTQELAAAQAACDGPDDGMSPSGE